MTSQLAYSFTDVEEHASIVSRDPIEVRWDVRPNTRVVLEGLYADVYLYGSRIATLYPDNKVRLLPGTDMSDTTRNRLNDILIPLGLRLKKDNGKWFVVSRRGPMTPIDYRPNLLVRKGML